jgi:lipopolysaccharide/colanic/teichoic acid biosynthesis glycosyltransferase
MMGQMHAQSRTGLDYSATVADLHGWNEIDSRTQVGHLAKRIFDIVVAGVIGILLAPVLVVAMLLVRFTSPGPVLFAQPRIGYCGREFRMYKLRTMYINTNATESEFEKKLRAKGRVFFKVDNDPRVTPVGRFLRKYSIDELPQLLNVLKGDMSIIGPRPLLPYDYEGSVVQDCLRRFSMLPGLTGLWQVSGRSALSDTERLMLDLKYVDEWNFSLDMEIFLLTPLAVISGKGAW